MATVKHFKLIGGEEVIGIVKEDLCNDEHTVMEKVRALMAQPVGQGQVGIGMVPYLMGNPDGPVQFRNDMIIGVPLGDTPKNLEDGYLQQVSGITFATSGGNGGLQI